MNRHQGFTLVEIAIVLVIIGLLLGGILKGQEMITQAKIKNSIADFSGISAAYHGYQDRYRAIPGDDTGATRWTGAVAGSGNGVLAGLYNSQTDTDETRKWWDHLRRAGLVAGNGTQQPYNVFAGVIGVQTGNGAGGSALGGFSGLIICSANIPDKAAIAIDMQMDDAVNYGAIGSVIGHEISHSFDSSGALFDEKGKMQNWWAPEDFKHFEAACNALARQYDQYEPFPGLHLKGDLELAENVADVAGLATAYDAYKLSQQGKPEVTLDGFTPDQRFYLGFAQAWRSKAREAAYRNSIKTGTHAPGPFQIGRAHV